MIEILSCVVKLLSWAVLAARNRWGFMIAVAGELAAAVVCHQAGLHWLAAYCVIAAGIQAVGFYRWGGSPVPGIMSGDSAGDLD